MTQKAQILEHLLSGQTITPLQALRLYGCMRLASRIDELRHEGHKIRTDLVHIHRGTKRIARYSMEKPQ